MKQRLKHYLSFMKDRKIVIWGMGPFFTNIEGSLKQLGIHFDFFTSTDSVGGFYQNVPIIPYNQLSPETHYVIIASSYCHQITPLLEERNFQLLQDFYPWSSEVLSEDFLYDGVLIGKGTFGYLAYADVLGESTSGNSIKSIGRFTSISKKAYMSIDHPMKMLGQGYLSFLTTEEFGHYKKKFESQIQFPPYNRVTIGHDVWIGANTFINASKVHSIGNGAVIGTGAVVIEDVPPYAVVVGAPARIIKYRFTEKQIEILERVQWWNWDNKTLYEHKEYFFNPDLFFEKYSS